MGEFETRPVEVSVFSRSAFEVDVGMNFVSEAVTALVALN
jgi:hypothetical protein